MASSTQKNQHISTLCGATSAPPPTPSSQANFLSTTEEGADALSRLLHRLPSTLSLSFPSRRSSSSTTTTTISSLPTISLTADSSLLLPNIVSASQLGFFQLTNHSISSQLAKSAELESLSFFRLPCDQKQLLLPQDWPLGLDAVDDEDDNAPAESFCIDSSMSIDSATFSFSSLREFTREMEKVALEILEAVSQALGFKNPAREDTSRICNLMWITNESLNTAGRLYPYVIGLQFQTKCQKFSLFADSGPVYVSPEVDSILVTLGDIAQVWSNGKSKKVRGRPASTGGDDNSCSSQRVSMTLLLTLPLDTIVRPLTPIASTDIARCNNDEEIIEDDDTSGRNGDEEEQQQHRVFNSFCFEDYAWRVYHQALSLKDPLKRYRRTIL